MQSKAPALNRQEPRPGKPGWWVFEVPNHLGRYNLNKRSPRAVHCFRTVRPGVVRSLCGKLDMIEGYEQAPVARTEESLRTYGSGAYLPPCAKCATRAMADPIYYRTGGRYAGGFRAAFYESVPNVEWFAQELLGAKGTGELPRDKGDNRSSARPLSVDDRTKGTAGSRRPLKAADPRKGTTTRQRGKRRRGK